MGYLLCSYIGHLGWLSWAALQTAATPPERIGSIGQDTALVKHEGYGSSSPRSAWRSTHYRYGQQLGAFAPFFETTSSINFAKHTDTRVDDQIQ